MRIRRPMAVLLTGVVGGVGLISAPYAAAQISPSDPHRQPNVTMSHSCASGGTGGTAIVESPNTVEVAYPTSVKPGEVFTAKIHSGAFSVRGSAAGRFALGYSLPDGVDVLAVRDAGGGQYNIKDAWAVAVERVTNAGAPDRDGRLIKISGGATPRFGGNENTQVWLQGRTYEDGIYAPANGTIRTPAVEVDLRAPVDRSVSNIKVGYHGTTSGQGNNPNNAYQYTHTSVAGGVRIRYCGRSYPSGRDSLTTTAVTTDSPVVAGSDTSLIGGAREVDHDEQTTFIAKVDVSGASGREMSTGLVTFRRTDTDEVIGTAAPNRDSGEAQVSARFPGTMDGYSFGVTASYAGVHQGGIQSIAGSSATGSLDVTVNPNRVRYNVAISQARRLPESGGNIPVELTTTISRPGGGAFATGLQAQLYRDGQPIGAPRPATASMTFTDNLPRSEGPTTYYYEVKLVPVLEGQFEHTGQTAGATGVIITGSSPSAPEDLEFVDAPWSSSDIFVPGGKEGSLEFGAGSIGSLSPFVTGVS